MSIVDDLGALTREEHLEQVALASPTPEITRMMLSRPPVTKDELWWLVKAMWGVELPRNKVCIDHQAPFDAFADAYFGNPWNWALWYGSRGTGKSYMLAILALTKCALLDIQVVLLGGSMAQSQNVHEHVESLMQAPNAPRHIVTGEKQTELAMAETFEGSGGFDAWIRPLPASQKTVRGPHPHMTLLDEIDEMEKKVYDAAMGQALNKENARGHKISEMVVASSTWQNPTGTFQEVFDEAKLEGKPIFTWCWREVLEPYGWMGRDFIMRKKKSVPREMFRVEYDLGEPSGESRAFDLEAVKQYFVRMDPVRRPIVKEWTQEWRYEEPDSGGTYAAGADWGKSRDWTVITVARTDVWPRRIVYVFRMRRRRWPVMIKKFNDIVNEYHASSAHDATGLGTVIADLVDERSLKVTMVQQKRTTLLTEYIVDFENGYYLWPLNAPPTPDAMASSPAFEAHKATTVDDVFGVQQLLKSHLPDDVASAAIMHRAAERMPPPAGPIGVSRNEDMMPKSLKGVEVPKDRVDGVVSKREDLVEDVFVPVLPANPKEAAGDGDPNGFGVFNLDL